MKSPLLSAAPHVASTPLHVLFFCDHTLNSGTRSGIQRVVFELAIELGHHVELSFVKWDKFDGQLRFLDARDLEALFGAGHGYLPHPACHRASYRFGDVLEAPERTWLLFPELPYLLPLGNEVYARILSQTRAYGVRSATVYYDAIPVREAAYANGRPIHAEYLNELVRSDLILAISEFAAADLLDYYVNGAGLPPPTVELIGRKTIAVPLGELRRGETSNGSPGVEHALPSMIMVGTVEPRKQQTRLLRVLNAARAEHPILAQLQVDVFGSLHPDASDEMWAEVARNPNIRYHQYVPDSVIEAAYEQAWFSAFPSYHEGYGLPIVESMRRGVPCLTANFGAMEEIARGGGCLAVDVLDDAALLQGLLTLCLDGALRTRLRKQIKRRQPYSWIDYAASLVHHMRAHTAVTQDSLDTMRVTLTAWLSGSKSSRIYAQPDFSWHCLRGNAATLAPVSPLIAEARRAGQAGIVVALTEAVMPDDITDQTLALAAQADLLLVASAQCRDNLVRAAQDRSLDDALPAHVVALRDAASACDILIGLSARRQAAHAVARTESAYMQAAMHTPYAQRSVPDLAIVISTFNRGPFVELNVRWLLEMIDREQLPVRCVVVDNTSTDDTFERLLPFHHHPQFSYFCNSANTGMLGNLRECSSKVLAKYIWLTGDDDFITPGAIGRTLEAIALHRGIPMLIHNFGVYHRFSLSPQDSPQQFHNEIIRLAPQASASGVVPVRTAAAEHDNLFTAIYPLVFRADLLATCFNYPFDGLPFGDLVECVPTTKYILEALAQSDAYWFKEEGIVGNAHNSWSRHRPRWHLKLMPAILDLARQSGVDSKKLWAWTGIHHSLFQEAAELAMAANTAAHLDAPADFDHAGFFFRKAVEQPAALAINAGVAVRLWTVQSA
ncbi:glycosyltransferase [Pseudoduganella namucuonensis]|uniref:Glycosyltransferase involved in cell wall bisynthesis n=1 Tax=Pseudoduganella namucuonensis TaxID=1035707 RepID=A0A1I7M5A9_9BURK|nr:glycosyltransferase [Pseudoduganella namucuonensis]SFV17086.1 Glycosyltransferase involved in cell wall bisynthesis [Pseudoduganella namucuonensis]